ncbi:hypothetical protein [Pedobacter heparinus]|uniref:hypothetical protein n=1 Tax=Pedobacter heparinus TaxID=984 RepID=UPI0029314D1C|nr:hypothetical protein [Pedobacter heparinus]
MVPNLRCSLALLFIVAMLSSCATNYQLAQNKLTFEDGIDVEMKKVQTMDQQSAWGGRYVAPRKHTFVQISLLITNKLGTDQKIDLTKFWLINPETKTKYPVSRIYQATAVVIGARDELKLKAGEHASRILMFTYPEKLRPEFLEVNGTLHTIAYN